MLPNIPPHCMYHNLPMVLVEQTLHPRHFFEETYQWFACSVSGCSQRYDMGHGYYVMRDGGAEEATNRHLCAECSHFLYMAKGGTTSADTMWLCSNEECPSNKQKARGAP